MSDKAILRGSFSVNTPLSRSSASERSVTCCDQRLVDVPATRRSYSPVAPVSCKNSAVPKPQKPLSISAAAKRGQSSGIGSPLIGGTTKKATSDSATAPTTIQPAQ